MNNIIKQKITELQQLIARFIYPDENTDCYFIENWQHIHSCIKRYSDELFPVKGTTTDEEASICLALLMSYSASVCRDEKKVQQVLNRTQSILPMLDASLLKCQLLAFCYTEVGEKKLLEEAYGITGNWKGKVLLKEEEHIMETLDILSEGSK
ncbi:UpxZ family transcription anti-terminator antagonist [Phocaeicola sp.]